jgi:hypothetical protein
LTTAEARCAVCGSPNDRSTSPCAFCRAEPGAGHGTPHPPARSVPEAVNAWARSISGAPEQLSRLVTHVEVHDEIIYRLFTRVVRRDLCEERAPAAGGEPTGPRLDPQSVDPFGTSTPSLRAASEHIATCSTCRGASAAQCQSCGGSKRIACAHCGGQGQELRQYKRSSRVIKCTACRGKQTVKCPGCEGKGVQTCGGCRGSGRQLTWLTYSQTEKSYAIVAPQTALLNIHRQLNENRPVARSELDGLSVADEAENDGPLPQDAGGADSSARDFIKKTSPSFDPRFERIAQQQYLKVTALRRDVIYEMSGMRGRICLTGDRLVATSTPEALAPIQRRFWLWAGAAAGLVVATGTVLRTYYGQGLYFGGSNVALVLVWLMGTLLCIVATGAVARELGPRFRLSRLTKSERVTGALGLFGIGLLFAVGLGSRPRLGEVQAALSAGDLKTAGTVVEALKETQGSTPEVLDADDGFLLARAAASTGDERLELLDAVSERKGPRANAASQTARRERLEEIRRRIEANTPAEALAAITRWYPNWHRDAETAELRAKAHDVAFEACSSLPCRFDAASKAETAATTPARATQRAEARRRLIEALTFAPIAGELTLVRLKRLRALGSLASEALSAAGGDGEVVAKAVAAQNFASTERFKVPLLGNDDAVATELLGKLTAKSPNIAKIDFEGGTELYLVLDAQHKCRGVYAVGTKGARTLPFSGNWSVNQLLTQAVGQSSLVKRPTTTEGTVRWAQGGAAVVARWKGGDLVEVRVGDAFP